jgi:hypothetical protein
MVPFFRIRLLVSIFCGGPFLILTLTLFDMVFLVLREADLVFSYRARMSRSSGALIRAKCIGHDIQRKIVMIETF